MQFFFFRSCTILLYNVVGYSVDLFYGHVFLEYFYLCENVTGFLFSFFSEKCCKGSDLSTFLLSFLYEMAHRFFFMWAFNFDYLPSNFSLVWGPVLEGNFDWLPLRIYVAQKAPVSFTTHPGLLHSLALVIIAYPVLSQMSTLCFPVSFCCLFRISTVLKLADTLFLYSASSVQRGPLRTWGSCPFPSLEIWDSYRCCIHCPWFSYWVTLFLCKDFRRLKYYIVAATNTFPKSPLY